MFFIGSLLAAPLFTFSPSILPHGTADCQNQLPQWIESRGDPVAELPLVGYCRRYFHLS